LNASPGLRGVGPTGEQRWTAVAPGEPLFGDSFGGVVSNLLNSGGERVGFARSSGPSGTLPWRYESAGLVARGAQSPDGTIFARENMINRRPNGSIIVDPFVLVLEGDTGRARLRIPVPREILFDDECAPTSSPDRAPQMSTAVVGADGSGYIAVRSARFIRLCSGELNVHRQLKLLRLRPNGAVSSHILFEYNYTGPNVACTFPNPTFEEVLPDSLSGVLVTWRRRLDSGCNGIEKYVSRVAEDGMVTQFALPSFEWSVKAAGEGVAYLGRSSTIASAVNVTNWAPTWSIAETSGAAAMPLADGGLAVQDSPTGTILTVSGAGVVTQTSGMNAFRLASSVHFGVWEVESGGRLVSLSGPELHEAIFSFVPGAGTLQKVGNAQRSGAPRSPHWSPKSAAVKALQYYNPLSIEKNGEFGGSICKGVGESYSATIPEFNPLFSDNVIPSRCHREGDSRVADYHTHGNIGNDGFSGGDIIKANADSMGDFYMEYFVATPCGNIFQYRGPLGPQGKLSEKTVTPITCVSH